MTACTDSSNLETIKNTTDDNETRLATARLNPGQIWQPDNYSIKNYPPAPPYIPAPQLACTERVLVEGCVENAIVELTINGSSTTYSGVADGRGKATISVPALQIYDKLTATQTVNGNMSPSSTIRHVTTIAADQIPQPHINNPAWECGRLVGVEGVIPGTLLRLEKDATLETEVWSTDEWGEGFWPIKTSSSLTPVNAAMTVQQIYCPKDPSSTALSLKSEPVYVQASPNPLPEFSSVHAFEGTDQIHVEGTFFGSRNEYYRDSSGLGGVFAKWTEFNAIIHEPIDPNLYSYSATHELCPGSAPKPMPADIIAADKVEDILGDISIREPICPDTTALQIESSLSGRIAMSYNNNPVLTTTIAGGISTIGVPQNLLQSGGTIEVVQIAQGTSSTGNIEGTPATATVGAAFGLEIFGAESYTDQNTDETIEGFVRNGEQRSRGPRFELSCCAACDCIGCQLSNDDQCLVNGEPRTATLKMLPSGEQVTLYEDYPGHFTGRWDWFVENPNAAVWPPAAPGSEAILIDSPCGQEAGFKFNILVGESDIHDATAPDRIQLHAKGSTSSGITTKTLTQASTDATIDVLPDELAEITIYARDLEGLSNVSFDTTYNEINAPLSKSSDSNIVPIPTELSFDTTFVGPQPYDSFEIRGVGTNFSQNSNNETLSAKLTVRGEHPTPVLNNVSPANAYSNQTLTLNGDYLSYSALDTIVRFEGPNGTFDTTSFDASSTSLTDIQLPPGLNNYFGDIEVWVITRHSGPSGVVEKESNHLNITLLNRNGSFQAKSGTDFHSGTNASLAGCASNTAPGAITDVTIESSSSNDAQVRIESNGRADKVVGFDVAAAGNGAPSLGGVALFSNSCRVVAIMSDTGQYTPAKFTFSLYYFSNDTNQAPNKHIEYNIGFHYYNGTNYNYAPNAFGLMANASDGSVVAIGYPDGSNNSNGLTVFGQIHDMLKPDNSTGHLKSQSATSCSNCTYTMNLNGRDASLKVNNTNLVNWTLNN